MLAERYEKPFFLLSSLLLSSNLLFGAEHEQSLKNRLGTHLHVLYGAHLSAFYERRFSNIFALEVGGVGGENFIAYGYSRLSHVGPYCAPNLYFTKLEARHHFYFSPSLS